MAKINFGNTHDKARRETHVVTSGRSSSEIDLGDQYDSSVRIDNVLDLPDDEPLSRISNEIVALLRKTEPLPDRDTHSVEKLTEAAAAAAQVDAKGMFERLRQAGSWALSVAKEAGSDLLVSALKKATGLS